MPPVLLIPKRGEIRRDIGEKLPSANRSGVPSIDNNILKSGIAV